MQFYDDEIPKSQRITRLVEDLYAKMPQIEADRAVLLTESYKETEGEPIIIRRAKAFEHICKNIPITIRTDELIVGSATTSPRSCQVFPEFSFEWLESELDTIEKRSADPFYISDDTKKTLKETYKYWKGKTTSDLASSYMLPQAKKAIDLGIFTPGNYFYNGIGHVTVDYKKVLAIGYEGIMKETLEAFEKCKPSDPDYGTRTSFLKAVLISAQAVSEYAKRYSGLASKLADSEKDQTRKEELQKIAKICERVPRKGSTSFYEACQSFWFVQMLIQTESSGHSISPGRFDQYMYPYYKNDLKENKITPEQAQELIDCIWVKLNDLNKARDAASAEGFAGYSLFQNLIVGGQDEDGMDATNDLSFMCLDASVHVFLPQPSISIRVWNGSPQELLLKAASVTRTGLGFPAYYNDEVVIPSLQNRGLSLKDARDYDIIGCVEPQKAGKTDGWHDAAFFNMCRPLELVFSNGVIDGEQIGLATGNVLEMKTFEEFYSAYKKQMNYFIELLVNSINSIDLAHANRCPLPYLSSMIEDCIGRGKSVQEGGAVYNFTGPQGFGIANMTDALFAVRKLVYEEKKISMKDLSEALENNFGKSADSQDISKLVMKTVNTLAAQGKDIKEADIIKIAEIVTETVNSGQKQNDKYQKIREMILEVPKFGNDVNEVDQFAREVAYTYTLPLETFKNPRGGQYQAGLYPVSANVPLGASTGATPDGRYAWTPVADGVSPSAGRDTHGPTAAANSVAKLDHFIPSNGTLFNQKFHPTALEGKHGLETFVAYIRGYFDQKGSHMQFNVVSRETLLDAQKNPENYKSLVVRVAGYSALFTTLSKSLQDDIINRTEQGL